MRNPVPQQHVRPSLDIAPAVINAAQENGRGKPTSGYILQVATFRELERAELVWRQMSAKGFDVFIEQTSLQEGDAAYRVRLGPFAELATAQEAASSILAKSGYRPVILPTVAARQEANQQS